MKKLLLVIFSVLTYSAIAADNHNILSPLVKHSEQLVLITAPTLSSSAAKLQLYQRKNIKQPWQKTGHATVVVIGKKGLAEHKQEGDLRTPIGIFPITGAFGFGPGYIKNIKLPYQQILPTTICVNDSQSSFYNRIINAAKIKNADWSKAEQMGQNPQYMWGITIGYNSTKVVPNNGSCIFIHVWNQPDRGTTGSIAMSEQNIEHLVTWLNSRKKPVVVIISNSSYKNYLGNG